MPIKKINYKNATILPLIDKGIISPHVINDIGIDIPNK